VSRDGYLPPGVTYNDIDPPTSPQCEDCDEKNCPGEDNCPKISKEPARVDDLGDDE